MGLHYSYYANQPEEDLPAINTAVERAQRDGNFVRQSHIERVLLDLNADWTVATTYLNGRGIDDHLRQTNSITGVSYFLTDHLGTAAALTDATGNTVEQLAYDSFGNSAGSARTRYGYTGRERDPETGVLHYRARFYDPQVGRFLSEDPIGLVGGFNLYEYAYDNPLRFVDPTGTQWREAALAGGGTLGGLSGTGALGAAAAAALPPVASCCSWCGAHIWSLAFGRMDCRAALESVDTTGAFSWSSRTYLSSEGR